MITVDIIGAGLAGSEAALTLANAGVHVQLFEMRPRYTTAAHTTGNFAELVCSNSLKSRELTTALGMLRHEVKQLGGCLYKIAEEHQVPAGTALAVNRESFSSAVTEAIKSHPNINVIYDMVPNLNDWLKNKRSLIIATGPLTQDLLWLKLTELVGKSNSYFYDATAPIIEANSINRDIVFDSSRWNKNIVSPEKVEIGSYLNCPLNKEEYDRLYEELLNAELAPLKYGEDLRLFAGCMPIEEIARTGVNSMRFGPLKPIGIIDPATGRKPYAIVQLRAENSMFSAFNMVGFQTRLKYPEQERIFRLIPGLEQARFIRFGRMHRNNYLNTPEICDCQLRLKSAQNIRVAGQITGAEGYNCAIATGFLAAKLAKSGLSKSSWVETLSEYSCLKSLLNWLTYTRNRNQSFDPTSFNFAMFTYLPVNLGRKKRREQIFSNWEQWLKTTTPD